MHMYCAFDNHIYSFLFMTTYVFPVWQTYFFFLIYANKFEIVHTCASIQNTSNPHEVFSDSHKYLLCKPYFFLHIYDLLNIPHLAVIFLFPAM